jgi:hypothetical protein
MVSIGLPIGDVTGSGVSVMAAWKQAEARETTAYRLVRSRHMADAGRGRFTARPVYETNGELVKFEGGEGYRKRSMGDGASLSDTFPGVEASRDD